MQIRIKTSDVEFLLEVSDASEPVENLRAKVVQHDASFQGRPLLFAGQLLMDGKSLSDYNIREARGVKETTQPNDARGKAFHTGTAIPTVQVGQATSGCCVVA
jgi:hypothetical protein